MLFQVFLGITKISQYATAPESHNVGNIKT